MSDSVVVGWISGPEGQAAVEAAVEEARRRQGRLVVVHSTRGGGEDAAAVVATRDALADLETKLTGEGLQVTVRDLVRGNDPADDLIEVAEKEDAALIVIGLRRRSPVGKLLM